MSIVLDALWYAAWVGLWLLVAVVACVLIALMAGPGGD